MSVSCAASSLPGLVPSALQRIVPVVEQQRLARDTWRLRLAAPEMARQVVPGQFFMIREPGNDNPLLGRPFALYDTFLDASGEPAGIDIVYLVMGKMSRLMCTWRPGDAVELWGPLGNGFPPAGPGRLLLVAGGIGNTPFPAVARAALGLRVYGDGSRERGGEGETRRGGDEEIDDSSVAVPVSSSPPLPLSPSPPLPHPGDIVFCYGVRSADYFAGLDDFAALGVETRLATDDGSRGHHGFVTDLVLEELTGELPPEGVSPDDPDEDMLRLSRLPVAADGVGSAGTGATRPGSLSPPLPLSPSESLKVSPSPLPTPTRIYCCGPEPMMHAVAEIAARFRVPCWLSLETPMACGFGACFSCVTRVRLDDGGWDYRRVCVEGPVFPAERLVL